MNQKSLRALILIAGLLFFGGCFKEKESTVSQPEEIRDLETPTETTETVPEETSEEVELDIPTQIFNAVVAGDQETFDRLLPEIPSIDSPVKDDRTPLMVAVEVGRKSFAEMLIESYGADVNATGSPGFTALKLALLTGYDDLVTYLLEQGADPNLATEDGETVMNLAARTGIEKFKRMEAAGGDINSETGSIHPPLYEAVYMMDRDITTYILQNSPELDKIKPLFDKSEMPRICADSRTELSFLYPASWGDFKAEFWKAEMGEKARLAIIFPHENSDFRNISITNLEEYRASEQDYERAVEVLLQVYRDQKVPAKDISKEIESLMGWNRKGVSDFRYIESRDGKYRGVVCFAYITGHYATPDLTLFALLTDSEKNLVSIRFSEKTSNMEIRNKLTESQMDENDIQNFVEELWTNDQEAIVQLYRNEMQYVIASLADYPHLHILVP